MGVLTHKHLIYIVLCVLITQKVWAIDGSNLKLQIQNIFLKKTNIKASIQFYDLKRDQIILEHNSDLALIPASILKLVTTALALDLWGADKKFKTKFYYKGVLKNNKINGDLVIVGDGDPFVVSEKLWQLSYDIYNMGIREITGDVIIDNSLFEEIPENYKRFYGNPVSTHAYDAPIKAFSVNFNTYAIAVSSGFKIGDNAYVSIDPFEIAGVEIKNNLKTVSHNEKEHIQIQRYSIRDKTLIAASGKIHINSGIKKFYRSVQNPVKTAGEYVKAFLNKAGIKINGNVKEQKINAKQCKLLIELEGYDLRTILTGLNHYSNNYIGDMLIHRLGAEYKILNKNVINSYHAGIELVNNFLKDKVKITTPFVVYDGSGLSPLNRLSSQQVVKLLRFIVNDFELYPNFMLTLTKPNTDGTLKSRFQRLDKYLRAKTGTLSVPVSVSSLAGYLYKREDKFIAFSIILNGDASQKQPSLLELKNIEDQLLNLIFKNI